MDKELCRKYLRRIDLFESFTEQELDLFSEGLKEFSCSAGTVIFYEGDPGQEMYILLEGELEVLKTGRAIAAIQPVEPVGEMAIIDQLPRSATIQATTDCLLLKITADHFQQVSLRSDSLLSMMRALSRRIRQDSERIAQDFEKANILIHDMKNILSTFVLVDLLWRKVTDGSADRIINAMAKARDGLAEMMEEALAAARHLARPLVTETASLVDLVKDMQLTDFSSHPDLAERMIESDIDETLPLCSFNVLAMRRVIMNLMLNGAQASRSSDPITLQLQQHGNLVRLSIVDHGVGIPDKLKPHLFSRQITTKDSGTGLGLLSCARIMEQHGGSLDFNSEYGQGTTMNLYLPMNNEQ